MAFYEFFVPGKPFGKQRPRVTRSGHAYTPDQTVMYENLVKTAFLQQYPDCVPGGGPVFIEIGAAFPVPQSWPKKKQAQALDRKIYPGKPDIDNIMKIIQDALNNVAYKDDAQIYSAYVLKFYAECPGVKIRMTVGGEHE